MIKYVKADIKNDIYNNKSVKSIAAVQISCYGSRQTKGYAADTNNKGV